jgi:hypothetical protein
MPESKTVVADIVSKLRNKSKSGGQSIKNMFSIAVKKQKSQKGALTHQLIPHELFPNICTLQTSNTHHTIYSSLLTLMGSTFKLHTQSRPESDLTVDTD